MVVNCGGELSSELTYPFKHTLEIKNLSKGSLIGDGAAKRVLADCAPDEYARWLAAVLIKQSATD